MIGGKFLMLCLMNRLKYDDLILYGPSVNYASLSDKEAERIIKEVAKRKSKNIKYEQEPSRG